MNSQIVIYFHHVARMLVLDVVPMTYPQFLRFARRFEDCRPINLEVIK